MVFRSKQKFWIAAMVLIATLPASSFAQSLVNNDGTPLETLFQISAASGKKVTCAGPINKKYVSGRSKEVSGTTMFFALTVDLAEAKKKLKSTTKASAKTKLNKTIQTLKTRIKTENKSCAAGPLQNPGNPTATPNPGSSATATPRPTSTPSSSGNFDSQGNVTSQGKTRFGIPSNINANSYSGANVWNSSCKGCHASQKTGYSFSFYKSAIKLSPMFITNKTDQEVADLTAYLRRFELL